MIKNYYIELVLIIITGCIIIFFILSNNVVIIEDASTYGGAARLLLKGNFYSSMVDQPARMEYNTELPLKYHFTHYLWVVIIALFFKIFGATLYILRFSSLFFHWMNGILVFVICRKLNSKITLISTMLVLTNFELIRCAYGLTEPAYTFFLLISLSIITFYKLNTTNILLSSILFSICTLLRATGYIILPILLIYIYVKSMFIDKNMKINSLKYLLTFSFTFLLIMGIWSKFVTPTGSQYSISLIEETKLAPVNQGDRYVELPVDPIRYTLQYPQESLNKFIRSLRFWHRSFVHITNPYLVILFILSFFTIRVDNKNVAILKILLFLMIITQILVTWVVPPSTRYFYWLIPFIIILGLDAFDKLIQDFRGKHYLMILLFMFLLLPSSKLILYPNEYNFSDSKERVIFAKMIKEDVEPDEVIIGDVTEIGWYANRYIVYLPLIYPPYTTDIDEELIKLRKKIKFKYVLVSKYNKERFHPIWQALNIGWIKSKYLTVYKEYKIGNEIVGKLYRFVDSNSNTKK